MSLVTYHTELVEGLDSMQSILEKLQQSTPLQIHRTYRYVYYRQLLVDAVGTFEWKQVLKVSLIQMVHMCNVALALCIATYQYLNKETILDRRNTLVSLQ